LIGLETDPELGVEINGCGEWGVLKPFAKVLKLLGHVNGV
jgi:hypothetical protein